MQKLNFTALVFLLVGTVFFPVRAEIRAGEINELLQSGDYERAYNSLKNQPADAENFFRRGLVQFKLQDYDRSREYFQRLIENYPGSDRALDGRYFLDRLKLYRPRQKSAPEIKVLLAQKQQLTDSFQTHVRAQVADQQVSILPGQDWTATRSGASVVLEVDDRRLEGEQIRFGPASAESLQFKNDSYRGELLLDIAGGQLLVINELPLDKYLYGVIKKEIAPGWPMQPVKAQAVAARSFALYYLQENIQEDKPYDLGATWLAQVYGGKDAETEQVIEAVRGTRGEVLVHRGRVVPGYFHANSGGYIETGEDVWEGTRTGFIVPRSDTWSLDSRHAYWEETISLAKINRSLAGEGKSKIDAASSLEVYRRLPSGRTVELIYETPAGSYTTVRADKFRLAIGPEKLKSTWFEELEDTGGSIRFTGRGWGHGVGMSQWGAYEMGQRGKNYREILSFYYGRAKIVRNYGFSQVTVER